jgi:hypothetical protein
VGGECRLVMVGSPVSGLVLGVATLLWNINSPRYIIFVENTILQWLMQLLWTRDLLLGDGCLMI